MKYKYIETAKISFDKTVKYWKEISDYNEKLNNAMSADDYNTPESAVRLSFDVANIQQVMELKEKLVDKNLKYFINIGIGGSSLGAKAVYDTIAGFTDFIEPDRFPKMIFADTNDSYFLSKVQTLIKKYKPEPNELLINVICKSGQTSETLENLEVLAGCVKEFRSRLVITTGEQSQLWEQAKKLGIPVLPIPKMVGGRFSVFSCVGLFPLACVGLNIVELLEGAMMATQKGLAREYEQNHAALSAILTYLHYKAGKGVVDHFFFHPELESLGKWQRQLMAESLGKDGKGITPTVSIGSSDLHSVAQLYLGGPKDKFFEFVWGKHQGVEVEIPKTALMPVLMEEIKGKTPEQVMEAIYKGVKTAFKNHELPFVEFILDDINEKSIGEFMQFKMIETMYLAKLMGVNAFDQPDVEHYKVETKKILKNM